MPKEERITLNMVRPNPLFEKWLEEWLNYAKEKDSMKKHVLQKALESLQKYPLVLHSGRDCAILEGFGTKLCHMLDRQLDAHRNTAGSVPIETETEHNTSIQEVLKRVESKIVRKRKTKEVVHKGKAAKNDVQSNEDILNDTDAALLSLANIIDPAPNIRPSNQLVLNGNSFKILLLVDTAETIGKSKRNLDATIQALTDYKVQFEVRRLSVGDFLWIAQDSHGNEAVLPYIVERKRMDDLASSIKDGRFREQKFRLKNSDIKNVIYMIENKGSNQHLGLPIQNLMQAITNLQIHSGFSVKITDTHEDSMRYLSLLTKTLIKQFEAKNLIVTEKSNVLAKSDDGTKSVFVMNFKEFNVANAKMRNFTIRDMFIRQLLQLKGLSLDKALAITAIYPTPFSLISAYENNATNPKENELLLAAIQCGESKRKIGPNISRIIYQFFHTTNPS